MNGFLSYSSEFTKYCHISLVWRKNDAFRMRQSLGECIEVPFVRKLGVHTFCGDVFSKESFAWSNVRSIVPIRQSSIFALPGQAGELTLTVHFHDFNFQPFEPLEMPPIKGGD